MSELQPGMLALVIGTKNAGKIVTLVERAVTGHRANGRSMFLGEAGGWYVVGDQLFALCNDKEVVKNFSYILDKYLMPINPSADPLDVTNKEELHA